MKAMVLLVILIPAIAFCAPLDESSLLKEISNDRSEPIATIANESEIVDKPIIKSIDTPLEATRQVDAVKTPSSVHGAADKTELSSRAGGLVGGLIGGLVQGLGGIVRGAEHAIGGVLETIQPGMGMQGGMGGGLGMGGGMGGSMGRYGQHIGGMMDVPIMGTIGRQYHRVGL